ncbi:arginine--tRNA ligase [Tenuifilum thalassicum]|uniref:Arginine--tRNA ligase n=1 Tax=Tenuifilum thalassicum TaxID=2590900 RepID=A0A7D3XML2_9BACT|nr:arginine--tRNA ligase [Tenuifilum thalassicum]QKG81235.1 arginine--tRNA ligase [Tenuifilum thalassicum]
MTAEQFIYDLAKKAAEEIYGQSIAESQIQIQKTRKEFEGDYTMVAFPLLKISRKSPEATCNELGDKILELSPEVEKYNIIKGFLNITLSKSFWASTLNEISQTPDFGFTQEQEENPIVIEFSSPNTNKPLHLGHIRNNLLGMSISRIMEKTGKRVVKVNLVNDRGIHICKSMLAWQKFGNGETPESTGKKGDHLVGDYYVRFDKEYKAQVKELVSNGMSEEEAKIKAPIMQEAQEMLRKWEAKDPEVIGLWKKMNGWVYEGFDKTYADLGITFDKIYYESDTYLLGKSIVLDGLKKGIFFKKDDGSIWIDLTNDGLDEKLLLRGDGTSVYITQDIGTAIQRYKEFKFGEHIYVVGNEQEYHFQVLKLIMKKLGYDWSDTLYHLSYGMVQLPEGKMKSREGTVVDADDLVKEMIDTARQMSKELGKLDDVDHGIAEEVNRMVGLAALKYFILKVDPKKNMTFNPKESIDFNGNTGPFIQYTHARIKSVLAKATAAGFAFNQKVNPEDISNNKELDLIQLIGQFPEVLQNSAQNHNPSLIANYAYELAKEYNQFYHDYSILKEQDEGVRKLRLTLSACVADVIKRTMWLLGIEVPEKM